MNSFEEKVIDKLDKITDTVNDIKVENANQTKDISRNTDNLEKHMKRSDLLEEIVDKHKEDEKVHKIPLTVRNLFMKLVFVFGGVGTIAGATYGIFRLLDMLK